MPSTTSRAVRTVNLNPQSGLDRYRGSLGKETPTQSYKLQLTQRSSLNLGLSNLKANADLTLVNQSGDVIDRSNRSGRNAESITQTLESGTYYIRIDRRQGKTNYQLNIDLAAPVTAAPPATSATAASLSDQVLALVNQQRRVAGVKPLRLNAQLTASAEAHSQDMALNDYFGHTSIDGRSPEARILASGYDAFIATENIAGGFSTPEAVVQAWMNSPGHRANLLNGSVTEMGVGFYFLDSDLGSTNYRYYWTQDFGQPMF
jgi:uncharacterized protein YkwD